jgi:hypothetical protein
MNETCNGVVDPKVNPWEDSVIEKLLSNLKPPLSEYKVSVHSWILNGAGKAQD